MNAITKEEKTALTLPERAAVALGESANEAKLRELVAKSAGIVSATNPDGREEAHRAGMVLLKTRTSIDKAADVAVADAKGFVKAVGAKKVELIAIIQPEETRVMALRDAWDEKIAAEKAAKIAAERARTEAIQARIQRIRDIPMVAVGCDSAAIENLIAELDATVIDDTFEEMRDLASAAWLVALESLNGALVKAKASEAAALAAEEARKAEAARIEQERATLAAQRAEQERVANENAATAKRLADQEAAQALAAKQLADKAAANLRAEREAQETAMRLQREADAEVQRKAAADLKAAQDALAAQVAAHNAAVQMDADHTEALADNAQFDIEREVNRIRMQAMYEQALTDAAALPGSVAELKAAFLPLPESYSVRDAAINEGVDEDLTDEDIIEFGKAWDLELPELVERLERFCVYARAELLVAQLENK